MPTRPGTTLFYKIYIWLYLALSLGYNLTKFLCPCYRGCNPDIQFRRCFYSSLNGFWNKFVMSIAISPLGFHRNRIWTWQKPERSPSVGEGSARQVCLQFPPSKTWQHPAHIRALPDYLARKWQFHGRQVKHSSPSRTTEFYRQWTENQETRYFVIRWVNA